ncbi:MAG: alpha/beta hydrolase [Bacteroidota bacterium]|nr:alpha/beta hydrolase [Bacteroidota bacterium]MDP4247510.1 alpha/beta hydrolase [Bacteroidota bacterium]
MKKTTLSLFFLIAVLYSAGVVAQTDVRPPTQYRTVKVDGLDIFYREAGDKDKPLIVLLHGFPSSSQMYRDLMSDLANDFHLIAPDYPGFGNSSAPSVQDFDYTFDHLATIVAHFIEALGLTKYSLYMQDYGGPIGFRIATQRPQAIQALIVQNANAYMEGIGEAIGPLLNYSKNPNPQTESAARSILTLESTKWQYLDGAEEPARIDPDSYAIDQFYLDRKGNDAIQLSLFRDYKNNLTLYDKWHSYLRKYQPPVLIISGKNDKIFVAAGAAPFKKDVPTARIQLLNGGHFVLAEKHREAAQLIRDFLR